MFCSFAEFEFICAFVAKNNKRLFLKIILIFFKEKSYILLGFDL
jgi:hypothetical protein